VRFEIFLTNPGGTFEAPHNPNRSDPLQCLVFRVVSDAHQSHSGDITNQPFGAKYIKQLMLKAVALNACFLLLLQTTTFSISHYTY